VPSGYARHVIRLGRRGHKHKRVEVRPGYAAREVDVVGEVRSEAAGEGVVVVVLDGEHDLGTVPHVKEALGGAAADGKAILVDLCTATFVDSSILGALLEARRTAVDSGRGFAVACSGEAEPVRRVLEVTGLADELPVHPTREAALAALDAREPS
jgi:anti-sigma B factor antagonist